MELLDCILENLNLYFYEQLLRAVSLLVPANSKYLFAYCLLVCIVSLFVSALYIMTI